jgi:hypothetical protein
MRNAPHGPNLYWQYRVILPGQQAVFEQIRHMSNDQPAPMAGADTDITAYAQFIDIHGKMVAHRRGRQREPDRTRAATATQPDRPPATMFGLAETPA